MRTGITIEVSSEDRRRLEAIVEDRNSPQKHVWRVRIVLLTADGIGTNGIMQAAGKAKTCVWRWQERFAEEGVDGLLRDKIRPSRIPALDRAVVDRVVALTLNELPPREATHWTGAMMAKAAGISVSSVQRIWRAHGLKDLLTKKMVTPAARREAVAHLRASLEVSERRACTIIAADRSTVRYCAKRSDDAALHPV